MHKGSPCCACSHLVATAVTEHTAHQMCVWKSTWKTKYSNCSKWPFAVARAPCFSMSSVAKFAACSNHCKVGAFLPFPTGREEVSAQGTDAGWGKKTVFCLMSKESRYPWVGLFDRKKIHPGKKKTLASTFCYSTPHSGSVHRHAWKYWNATEIKCWPPFSFTQFQQN